MGRSHRSFGKDVGLVLFGSTKIYHVAERTGSYGGKLMSSILRDLRLLLKITLGPEYKAMCFHLISMLITLVLMDSIMHYHSCLGHHVIAEAP